MAAGLAAGMFACRDFDPVCETMFQLVMSTLQILRWRMRKSCRFRIKASASRTVLDGLAVKVDAKIVRYPDRYHDNKGRPLFDRVLYLLGALVERETA
jgi:hypothetical protein